MSSIREVLFKVELDEDDSMPSCVLFASTSFERAMQWARDKFGPESWEVNVVSYCDADAMGFDWCGIIAPCLVWRRVYVLSTGECLITNSTANEIRHESDLAEWRDECAAAASWR